MMNAEHLAAAGSLRAAPDQAASIRFAHAWAEVVFAKPGAQAGPKQGIYITRARNQVLKSQSVWGTPLSLRGKQYEHGLYMDTPATVKIVLDQPAKEFTAEIGIDDNNSTRSNPEAGSARFHVIVNGDRVFSSPVLKLANGATPVRVPLKGAREVSLEVDDGGDGIGWDQCAWGDASVRSEDGTTMFLDELDLLGGSSARRLAVPFSSKYDGKSSDEFLDRWEFSTRAESTKDASCEVVTYRDSGTGLLIECETKTYPSFAAVDWVFHLSNTGDRETPVIEDFLPLDSANLFGTGVGSAPMTLRWSNGDKTACDSFLPHEEALEPGKPREFHSPLSSNQVFPFFNVRGPDGGWILAIGWTGAWKAEFLREAAGGVVIRSGMQKTHFRLRPGERVRMPSIVLLRWNGDDMIYGHNQFRRLMLAHYVQRLDGKPAEPPIAHNCAATVYVNNMRLPTEKSELALINRIAGLGCDTYWMDAYWYPQPWHANLGNWYPRPEDFPNGLRPLGDAAHKRAMKFVLWLLPPSVSPGTKWAKEYARYLHGSEAGQGGLWKMGDPEARDILTKWLCNRLDEWAVDIYREDGSSLPPEEGPEDRQGLTEMKHIEGLYRFWSDAVEKSHAQLMDNCCGGGNRIDIETSRRSFYLWRSDFNDIGEGLKGEAHWPLMARADQVMVTGLSLYVPFHTGPIWDMHPYCFRSAMTSGICLYGDVDREGFPDDLCRQAIKELKELRPLFQGDIYPLLPLTLDQNDWYAYQLDRPDLGEGCVFFFRRPESPYPTAEVRLYAIDPKATFKVSLTGETYERAPWKAVRGRKLLEPEVVIRDKPGSALLRYKRMGK